MKVRPFPKVGDKFCQIPQPGPWDPENDRGLRSCTWSAVVVNTFEDKGQMHMVVRLWFRRRKYYKYVALDQTWWEYWSKTELIHDGPLPQPLANFAGGCP